jgi:hypothetical protein
LTRERYIQWMAVWKCFQTQHGSGPLERLYGLLNEMWQQDRALCSSEQLAAYSQPLDELENDPEFRKFLDDLNKGFSN